MRRSRLEQPRSCLSGHEIVTEPEKTGLSTEALPHGTHKPGNNDDVYKYSRYYDISQDSLSFYDYNNEDRVTELDTIDSIGGQLSNLIYKINKLEKTI